MKRQVLFIARENSANPSAVEKVLSLTQSFDSATTIIDVVVVNVPHYSLIRPALEQVDMKVRSGEFKADEASAAYLQNLLWAVRMNQSYTATAALIKTVAHELGFPWLRPNFCILADLGE